MANLQNSKRRVLVIEDDEAIVRTWKRLLCAQFELEVAATFEAAWQKTEQERWVKSPFDFVLLDLRLPDGNGADILERLNTCEPCPAVAVISAFLDAHLAVTIHGRCAIAVPKPADQEVLLGILAILEESRSGGSVVLRFASAHGFSAQETRLLFAAAREATNEEAADELGCTHATVRSYWRRIFEKTGRHSAREVITHLFRFAIAPRPPKEQPAVSIERPPSSIARARRRFVAVDGKRTAS